MLEVKDGVLYRVSREKVDVDGLRRERDRLQAEILAPEPTDKELIAFAKNIHPWYQQLNDLKQERIAEIDALLKQVAR